MFSRMRMCESTWNKTSPCQKCLKGLDGYPTKQRPYMTKVLYWVVLVTHHSNCVFWKVLAVVFLVCQRYVFMSVILQIFRIHHGKRQKRTSLDIREKWRKGWWFFRQLSIMLLVEERNWSLTSTNTSQRILAFFSNTLSIHVLICCIWLFVQSKLHVDSLLLLIHHAVISRLECNITERNVKRFKFEIVEKLCKAVSLSFRDAEVIISNCNRISNYGRSGSPILEGVNPFEKPRVYKAVQSSSTSSYNVLISLVDGLEAPFTKRVDIFAVRKLADLQFRSLCQLLDLLLQRELRHSNV